MKSECDACEQNEAEQRDAGQSEAACNDVGERPRQCVADGEAEVAEPPRVAHAARPAQLVIPEACEGVVRDGGGDDLGRQHNALAQGMHARAEFVIVGEMLQQR